MSAVQAQYCNIQFLHIILSSSVTAKINGVPKETPQQMAVPGPHLCISQEALSIFQDRAYMDYPSEFVSHPGLGMRTSWLQALYLDTALWKGNPSHIQMVILQYCNWRSSHSTLFYSEHPCCKFQNHSIKAIQKKHSNLSYSIPVILIELHFFFDSQKSTSREKILQFK